MSSVAPEPDRGSVTRSTLDRGDVQRLTEPRSLSIVEGVSSRYDRRIVNLFLQLWFTFTAWLAPHPPWRRYRVAPRANPAAFRHDLLREIQLELRRTGLVTSRQIPDQTTL